MGDVALIGGSEALKRGIKTFKDSNAAQTLGNFAKSAIEYTPILGFVSRFQDGNAKAARKLVDNTLRSCAATSHKRVWRELWGWDRLPKG